MASAGKLPGVSKSPSKVDFDGVGSLAGPPLPGSAGQCWCFKPYRPIKIGTGTPPVLTSLVKGGPSAPPLVRRLVAGHPSTGPPRRIGGLAYPRVPASRRSSIQSVVWRSGPRPGISVSML